MRDTVLSVSKTAVPSTATASKDGTRRVYRIEPGFSPTTFAVSVFPVAR